MVLCYHEISFTSCRLCLCSTPRCSSIHSLSPWVSEWLSCQRSDLSLPLDGCALGQVVSHLCLCGQSHGVHCVEQEFAHFCGLFQSSWGNAESQSLVSEDQAELSLHLVHLQSGYV